jgi:hypothetical protein
LMTLHIRPNKWLSVPPWARTRAGVAIGRGSADAAAIEDRQCWPDHPQRARNLRRRLAEPHDSLALPGYFARISDGGEHGRVISAPGPLCLILFLLVSAAGLFRRVSDLFIGGLPISSCSRP